MNRFVAACAMVLLFCAGAPAQEADGFRVLRIPEPPKIDGVLDDVAWTQVPPMPTGEWASYNPDRGDRLPDPFRTDVRVAFDDRNVYFAFHCYDNEPDKSAPRSPGAIARSTNNQLQLSKAFKEKWKRNREPTQLKLGS